MLMFGQCSASESGVGQIMFEVRGVLIGSSKFVFRFGVKNFSSGCLKFGLLGFVPTLFLKSVDCIV